LSSTRQANHHYVKPAGESTGQPLNRVFERYRHAGHADIIRESIDGAAGLREGVSNMPAEAGAAAWKQHYDKLDQIARSAR
jgi:hypothetical protein